MGLSSYERLGGWGSVPVQGYLRDISLSETDRNVYPTDNWTDRNVYPTIYRRVQRPVLLALFLGIVLLFTGSLYAQSPSSVLKDLRKRYKKVTSLQTDFREVFEWEMTGETNIREGKMTVAADNRFRIETPEQLMVCDATDIYRYNKLSNQLIIESVSNASENILPKRLLLDFADGFEADQISSLAVDGHEGYRLNLNANDPEKILLKSAIIWASKEDLTVHRLKLIDLSGNSTTYYLSSIYFDVPIDSTVTSFTAPEGVELFDLR